MTDIFISYARQDQQVADALARGLTALGWKVFVDRDAIPIGMTFDTFIEEQLGRARSVMVLWSSASVQRHWVLTEAHEGLSRNVLLPVLIEQNVSPPLAFRRLQAGDLIGWDSDHAAPAFRRLVEEITRLLGPTPTTIAAVEGPSRHAPSGRQTHAQSPAATQRPVIGTKPAVAKKGGTRHAVKPRDADLEDIDGLAWKDIPGGTFTMGSEDEADAAPHDVTLSAYKITRVPITNAQYHSYIAAAKAKPPEHWKKGRIPAGKEDHPVVNVSWKAAVAFGDWLTTRVDSTFGGRVLLPTEAQWEFAARGKAGRVFPWGTDEPTAEHANFGNAVGDTTAVDRYARGATPAGVYDLAGNVWEWCRDRYGSYDPKQRSNPTGPSFGTSRVLRGGSFYGVARDLRAAFRNFNLPGYVGSYIGFRVVWSLAGGQT